MPRTVSGGDWVSGLYAEGGLNGEACNARGSEESVGREDHQVGGDSCTGGGVEASDSEDGLHIRMKKEVWLVNVSKPGFWIAKGQNRPFFATFEKIAGLGRNVFRRAILRVNRTQSGRITDGQPWFFFTTRA